MKSKAEAIGGRACGDRFAQAFYHGRLTRFRQWFRGKPSRMLTVTLANWMIGSTWQSHACWLIQLSLRRSFQSRSI